MHGKRGHGSTEPSRTDARRVDLIEDLRLELRGPRSGFGSRGLMSDFFARMAHFSIVPPIPPPTMASGGHAFAPPARAVATTKLLTPATPSDGDMRRILMFSAPPPFGATVSQAVPRHDFNTVEVVACVLPLKYRIETDDILR